MAWPSTLSSFTDPVPTDKLSTTPHSSIETAQNNGLRQVQAFLGTESSAVGTLIYDIRATASNGGGHVQTANKGGTGQTAYAKGDMLVAQSSSVLSKLAVGTDGQVMVADSSQSTGVKWAVPTTGEWTYQSTIGLAGDNYSFTSLVSHDLWKIRLINVINNPVSSVTNLKIALRINDINGSVYGGSGQRYTTNTAMDGDPTTLLFYFANSTASVYGFNGEYTIMGKTGPASTITIFGGGAGYNSTNDAYLLSGKVGTVGQDVNKIQILETRGAASMLGKLELWYKDNQ